MADFVPTTVNKTAVRDLAVPIATVTSFNNLIESVITDNPFGCVGYTTKAGQTIDPVVRNREHYTAKVDFIVEETGKRVGTVSLQSPTIAAFEANAHPGPRRSARRRPPGARTPRVPSPAQGEAPGTPYARQRSPPRPRRRAPLRGPARARAGRPATLPVGSRTPCPAPLVKVPFQEG